MSQTLASFEDLCDACAELSVGCLWPFTITETPPRIPQTLVARMSATELEDDEVCLL